MSKYQEYVKINPSIILRKIRPDDNQQVYSEDFDEETSIFRKLCLLPFEPIWYFFVIVLGLINSIAAMFNCIYFVFNQKNSKISVLFYFCDAVGFLNTSLLLCDKYIKNLKTTQIIFPARRIWWLILDYISVIPIDLLAPSHLQPYIGLNKILKIVYILFIFRFVNMMLESKISIRIFQLICQLLYFITLVSLIFTLILHHLDTNPSRHSVSDIVYIVTDQMTGKGFGLLAIEHYLNKFLVITSTLILFIGVLVICTANVTFLFLTSSNEKCMFRYKLNCLKAQIKRNNYDVEFIKCLEVVFDAMWTQANGSELAIGGRRKFNANTQNDANILSKVFYGEITIDMCTGIFKHSMLLRQLPVWFLRDLSACVTYEVYVEHQLIYKLDEVKDKMIYIYKGIVEIISDEDGETPIMKLTAGTCLSEICLFVPYRSQFLVRCSTICIFHVLKRNDFMFMAQKYPKIINSLRNDVKARFTEAKFLKEIQETHNKIADKQHKCTNLGWLLYILHRMTAIAHPHVAEQHAMANMLLERTINEDRFKRHIFSPMHLSLYTVPEERQDYNDTLFAKSTFPYVFKPDTGLIYFWEVFIGFMALTAGIVIPYFAFTHQNTNIKNIQNAVYFFTGLWLVDLIIQLRISIIYEKKVVSGFVDIFIMKLTSKVFLLDIASVIPLEIFSGVIVYPSNQNYVYMNRILKLARVLRLLARWEGRYNSNPLHVRFVCAILYIFYSVFILSCVFYYIGHQEERGMKQFEILLFYTSQMLTGVSLWVEGYSNFRVYQFLTIALYLFICTIYSLMYGMIFSAYASVQLNVQRITHNTKALITAAICVDPRYEHYIHDVMHDIIIIDNGFTVQFPGYAYNSLPKEFIGYFFTQHYEPKIKDLPIFGGIPRLVLKKIFEEAAYTCNYSPHEVLFHVGELLEDFYLLLSGTCETINGVTLHSHFVQAVRELNTIEVALVLPMRTTVITHTHCSILRIKYAVMRRVLCENASTKYPIRGQLSGLRDIRAKIQHAKLKYFNPDLLDSRKKELFMQSHVFFSRVNPHYLNAYKEAGMFRIRWMFMNLTFCPGGKFLEIWEIIRCICALLSALTFTSITFCFYKVPHPVGIVKWALEVMAFLDIYIRLHVAYYNETGVLITHPSRTIIYYIKHGLCIDLFAALPLHLSIRKAENVIVNMNKVLQLHRYFSFIRHKQQDKVVPPSKGYMFAHIPTMLVLINIMASLMLLLNCKIDMSNIRDPRIECERGSIFDLRDHPLTDPNVAHLFSIYLVLSVMSKIAVQGFKVTGQRNMLLVALISLFGFCLDIINAARIFGYFINHYVGMMHNDLRMKRFKKFILAKKGAPHIPVELIKDANDYIKKVFATEKYNLHKRCVNIPSNVRRDILYRKFAPALLKSFLPGANEVQGFVGNLIKKSEYRMFEANGIVQRNNDICEDTIIIFSGLVVIECARDSIENSDENLISSGISLGPGSIIGNLCPLKYNRLKVDVIALGALELLYIKTNTFFEIMQHFQDCQEVFKRLRYEHLTHVPGKSKFKYPKQARILFVNWKITKHVHLAYVILNLLNFFGAYIPQIHFFHDVITVSIYGHYYHLITDGCYLLAIILVFFLPITDDGGRLMSPKNIIKKFFKTWLFYVSIFGFIPIYVFIPHFVTMPKFYIIAGSKANVLFRNFFFFKIIKTSITRSPHLMFVIEFIQTILIIILAIGGTTAILIFISEVDKLNMRPEIELERLLNASSEAKYDHMVTYLYIVTNMFTHTSQPFYYPVGTMYIIVFIITMAMVMVYNSVIYSTVVSMVQAIEQLKLLYLTQKNNIKAIMHRSDTSSILYDRLDFYCKMTWKKRKGIKIPLLFCELPEYLREAMSESLFGGILETHEFFGQIHCDLRRQLYTKLKVEVYYHGDFVAYQGTIDETMYFVHKGMVVSLADEATTIRNTFTPGQSFAMMQGITENLPHDLSYRVVCDSVILCLTKKDWDYMLHFYPASNRIITLIARTIYKPHLD